MSDSKKKRIIAYIGTAETEKIDIHLPLQSQIMWKGIKYIKNHPKALKRNLS